MNMELELLDLENKKDTRLSRIYSVVIIATILFLVSFITISTQADPPVVIPDTLEVPVEFLELQMASKEVGGGSKGGSGSPNDAQLVKADPPQVKEVLTNSDGAVSVNSGKSNKTNTDKPSQNTATTTSQAANPFGSGGSGGGTQGGSGGVFGADTGTGGKGNGTGQGDGNGPGKARVRYNNINVDHIVTSVEVKITLIVSVDASGKVIAYRTVGKETTTSDQSIISKVGAACKSQLKYAPGTGITEEYYTIVVKPK